MVALRRPDELPPPPEDGLPTRSIKPHTHDKLHYWGCFLEAASTALKRQFMGVRVCADLFASYGVCADSKTQERCWGSALLSLQVAAPFDLYFFNDINPEATRTLAARARALGISGAVVYELALDDPDVLRKARALRDVATIGPKFRRLRSRSPFRARRTGSGVATVAATRSRWPARFRCPRPRSHQSPRSATRRVIVSSRPRSARRTTRSPASFADARAVDEG